MTKTFYLRTFGCQQNWADSERITAILSNNGYSEVREMQEADLILGNSCSVRQHAEDRVFGLLKNAHALKKSKKRIIGLTGCMVRTTSDRTSKDQDSLLKRNQFLDLVFRIEDAPLLPELINSLGGGEICSSSIGENMTEFFQIKPQLKKPFSAFVPIMSGCNKFCTYCIVPYTRGREQSRPLEDITQEVKILAEKGVSQITLLGQNVNAYFVDDQKRQKSQQLTDFSWLLEELAKFKNLKRIYFTSPHPSQLSFDVLKVMAKHANICPQLHLPVQSGSDRILKAMNRSHTREDFELIIEKARQLMPELALSTDLIVGFPSESRKDFAQTLELVEKTQFDMIYIAKYSPRPGTAAAKLPDDVSLKEKKQRFNLIQKALEKSALNNNKKLIGKTVGVLVEAREKEILSGKTSGLKTIHFPNQKQVKIGDYVLVKVLSAESWFLKGVINKNGQ
jgi:tRNA-2-methylthio-N6-dimethylallyladenosine synthase